MEMRDITAIEAILLAAGRGFSPRFWSSLSLLSWFPCSYYFENSVWPVNWLILRNS